VKLAELAEIGTTGSGCTYLHGRGGYAKTFPVGLFGEQDIILSGGLGVEYFTAATSIGFAVDGVYAAEAAVTESPSTPTIRYTQEAARESAAPRVVGAAICRARSHGAPVPRGCYPAAGAAIAHEMRRRIAIPLVLGLLASPAARSVSPDSTPPATPGAAASVSGSSPS
jgi:hypothetical protein